MYEVTDLYMQKTSNFQRLSLTSLSLFGWKVDVLEELPAKCVLTAAHHTSNADFFAMLMLNYAAGLKLNWIAKDTAFRGPMGPVMRALGGVPVNRRSRNRFVDQMAELFASRETLHLVIAPEGTRGKVRYWKTGFYYIALAAQVPIVMGYIDYKRKVVGTGPKLFPSGDILRDMDAFRDFYRDITPRYPEEQGETKLRVELEGEQPDRQ